MASNAPTRLQRLYQVALWLTGRSPRQSYDCTRRLVELCEAAGETDIFLSALNLQATIELELGMGYLARQHLLRVLQMARAEQNINIQIKASCNLALLANMEGRVQAAMQDYERAYQLVERGGDQIDPVLRCRVLIGVADNQNRWGAPERALAVLERLTDAALELPRVKVYVLLAYTTAYLLLARQQRLLGRDEQVSLYLAQAENYLVQAEQFEDHDALWYLLAERGFLRADLYQQRGQQAEAEAKLHDIQAKIVGQNLDSEIEVRLRLAEIVNNPTEAVELLREALAMSQSSSMRRSQAEILKLLSARYEEIGEWQNAFNIQKECLNELERINHNLLRENAELLQATHDAATLSPEHLQGRLLQAERDARTDVLTGLANRRALDELLPGLLERLSFPPHSLHILLGDVDNFKHINDRHSHLVGDEVLRRIAALFRQASASNNFAVRYGGEEILLVLQDLSDAEAYALAEQLRQQVAGLNWGQDLSGVTLSLGLTRAHKDETAVKTLARADQALYTAKQQGRNQTVFLLPGEQFSPVTPQGHSEK